MVDGADLTFDLDAFDRAGEAITKRYVGAGGRAVQGTTKALERALEAATQAAVPGRLWRGWASRYYANRGTNPAGIVYVKGGPRSRGAMTFWSRPGEVRSKSGRFLAVPLPAAGKARTPAEWENAHNTDLEFVPRENGKADLLVAYTGGVNARGTFRRYSVRQLRAGRRGEAVPMFLLIRAVQFRNTVAIEPIVARAEQQLVDAFLAAAG